MCPKRKWNMLAGIDAGAAIESAVEKTLHS
jgi:hypothetical protein